MTSIGFIGASDTPVPALYAGSGGPSSGQEYASLIKSALGFDSMAVYVTAALAGAKLKDRTDVTPSIPGLLTQADNALAGGHDLVMVALASNDAQTYGNANATATFTQTASQIFATISTDLDTLIAKFTTASQPVLFVLDGMYGGPAGDQRCKALNAIIKQKLVAAGLPYVDMYEKMEADYNSMTGQNFRYWFRDYGSGIDYQHMGSTGHSRYAAHVVAMVQAMASLGNGEPSSPPSETPTDGYTWFDNTQSGTNIAYGTDCRIIQQASGDTGGSAIGAHGKSSGKWYFEVTRGATGGTYVTTMVGVSSGAYNLINNLGSTGVDDFWYDSSGRTNNNGSPASSTGNTVWDSAGDTIGVKFDLDGGTVSFIDKNGSSVTGFSIGAGTYKPIAGLMSGADNQNVLSANFGQSAFVHGLPSGYSAWDNV